MEIDVRRATKSDCKVVLTMIKELATFHGHPDKVANNESILIEDGFGENPWYYCLIAEVTIDEIKMAAGFVLYHRSYSTWNGKSFFVEDIYVREAYREKGVGYRMLKEVTRHVLREGGSKICWNALDWNTHAHEFYKKVGAEMADNWKPFTFPKEAMEAFVKS